MKSPFLNTLPCGNSTYSSSRHGVGGTRRCAIPSAGLQGALGPSGAPSGPPDVGPACIRPAPRSEHGHTRWPPVYQNIWPRSLLGMPKCGLTERGSFNAPPTLEGVTRRTLLELWWPSHVLLAVQKVVHDARRAVLPVMRHHQLRPPTEQRKQHPSSAPAAAARTAKTNDGGKSSEEACTFCT